MSQHKTTDRKPIKQRSPASMWTTPLSTRSSSSQTVVSTSPTHGEGAQPTGEAVVSTSSTDGAGAQPTIWSSSSARRARTTRRPTLEAVVSTSSTDDLVVEQRPKARTTTRPTLEAVVSTSSTDGEGAQPTVVEAVVSTSSTDGRRGLNRRARPWFRQAQPTGNGAVVSTSSTDGY